MKILITGSTGLLGQALLRHLPRFGEVTGLSRSTPTAAATAHITCDLLNATETTRALRAVAPDLVIYAQALSDVDRCEREPQAAQAQNVTTLAHVVEALRPTKGWLIYLSTDYVFDGRKGAAYVETDLPHPLSVYGHSKLAGETAALNYPRGVVVRTSTLFGSGRMNFCDHIVACLQAGQPVEAFADQVTSPTLTDDLAPALGALAHILMRQPPDHAPRVHHLVNAGGCSRVTFAQRVAQQLGCRADLIRPIPMAAQHRPALRPANSSLDSIHIAPLLGQPLRPWDQALAAYLHDARNA